MYIDVDALQGTTVKTSGFPVSFSDPNCPSYVAATSYSPVYQEPYGVLITVRTSNGASVNSGTVTLKAFNYSLTEAVRNGAALFAPSSGPPGVIPVPWVPAGTRPGVYPLQVTYNGATGLASSSGSASVEVERAAPNISWSNPADITFGTPLSATQLNATASVASTFTYNPPPGTVLPVGQGQKLTVTVTPTDTVDYQSSVAAVFINVLPPAVQLLMTMNSAVYPSACPETANSIMVSCQPSASAVVNVTFTNSGTAPVQNLQLTGRTLTLPNGSVSAVWVAPQPSLGTIAPGKAVTTVVNFLIPSSNSLAQQLADGKVEVIFSLSGTYTGGSFQSSLRFTL